MGPPVRHAITQASVPGLLPAIRRASFWAASSVSESPAFAAAWRSQTVLPRDGANRSFQHPPTGRCPYQQNVLRLAQHPGLRLTVLTPV
jgi:hypothetical protein